MQNSFFSDFFTENSRESCVRIRQDRDGCNGVDCSPNDKSCNFSVVDALPLAMAYVPMQKYENICSPEDGFASGTMFGDLNLPFYGWKEGGR